MGAEKQVRATLTAEGFRRSGDIARPAAARRKKTDFAALARLSDEEIEKRAADDPDALPMDDAEWAAAVRLPAKRYIHIGIDEDVLGWFQAQGKGYQTRINAVLRRFVDTQRKG
jgi:uncharacterized protein (DUF4415 family)